MGEIFFRLQLRVDLIYNFKISPEKEISFESQQMCPENDTLLFLVVMFILGQAATEFT